MNAAITGFQTQMTGFAATLGADFAEIKTEEDGLKQQIADLQAKQAAGTFGPDDQAALDSITKQYSDLVAKAAALLPPPAPTTTAPPAA